MKIRIYKDFYLEIFKKEAINKREEYVLSQLFVGSSDDQRQRVVIAEGLRIYDFLELVNSFLNNQLETGTGKEYKFRHQNPDGSYSNHIIAKIKRENHNYYLNLCVINTQFELKKEYFFDKYQCRIISRIMNKILSKCIPNELTVDGYKDERQY